MAGRWRERARRARNRASRWRPVFRFVSSSAVIVGHLSEPIGTEPERTFALSDHWKQVFSAMPRSPGCADQFLEQTAKPYDFSVCSPPTEKDIEWSLKVAKPSATGPGGIPAVGWYAAGAEAYHTLWLVMQRLLAGDRPPLDFNLSISTWIAKGDKATDAPYAPKLREAKDHRPLGLKNNDNKCIASVISRSIALALVKSGCPAQRGFVLGENILENVVELDAEARYHAIASRARSKNPPLSTSPLFCLFDFKPAFSSVAHSWMVVVLSFSGALDGLLEYIGALYWLNYVVTFAYSSLILLFPYLSGILQGCPMSAFLFDMSVDSFLCAISSELSSSGMVRACAADFAVVVAQLVFLARLFTIFRTAADVVGLVLNLTKCIVILAVVKASPHTTEMVELWLTRCIPEWASFPKQGYGELLGIMVGPKAGMHMWAKAYRKYMVVAAPFSPNFAVIAYNTFAAPTSSYISQVVEPPPYILSYERHAIGRVLRLLGNSLTSALVANLDMLGLGKAVVIQPLLPCALRVARKSIKSWPLALSRANSQLSLLSASESASENVCSKWPAFWDTGSFALRSPVKSLTM